MICSLRRLRATVAQHEHALNVQARGLTAVSFQRSALSIQLSAVSDQLKETRAKPVPHENGCKLFCAFLLVSHPRASCKLLTLVTGLLTQKRWTGRPETSKFALLNTWETQSAVPTAKSMRISPASNLCTGRGGHLGNGVRLILSIPLSKC